MVKKSLLVPEIVLFIFTSIIYVILLFLSVVFFVEHFEALNAPVDQMFTGLGPALIFIAYLIGFVAFVVVFIPTLILSILLVKGKQKKALGYLITNIIYFYCICCRNCFSI